MPKLNAKQKALLQALGARPATSGAGPAPASSADPSSTPLSGDKVGGKTKTRPQANEYGTGYEAFDTRQVHPILAEALKTLKPGGGPPRLPRADEWRRAAPVLSPDEKKTLLAKRTELTAKLATVVAARQQMEQHEKKLADATKFDAAVNEATKPTGPLSAVSQPVPKRSLALGQEEAQVQLNTLAPILAKLEGATPRTKSLDFQTRLVKGWIRYWDTVKDELEDMKRDPSCPALYKPKTVAPTLKPNLDDLRGDAIQALEDAQKERDNYKKTTIDPLETDMASCMPILDAPENNPERETVGRVLGDLEKLQERHAEALRLLPPGPAGDAKREAAAKEFVKAKSAKLFEMEKTLFAWNDRRTRSNLPPSSEAVAMADLLQKAHAEVIKEVVAKKWPLPVADADKLSDKEDARLQEMWANLRDGKGKVRLPSPPADGDDKKKAELEQLRAETLANFARLLGSEGGRSLVDKLNKGAHPVTFVVGAAARCELTDAAYGASGPAKGVTEEDALKKAKGTGSGSIIHLPLGAKDSDVALRTKEGNALFSPRFLAMGHELIHALHNSHGSSRTNLRMTADEKWGDMEEYQTIIKGKLSEQVLRNQYGLSAERFGHESFAPGQPVADAYADALRVADEMGKRGPEVDNRVHGLGFDAKGLTDKTKLAILDNGLSGPLPKGWDPNELTVAQMKDIFDKKIPFRLKKLGWSPFDLPNAVGEGDTIEEVTRTSRSHPRSPEGRRFEALGGEAALKRFDFFKEKTGHKLPPPDKDFWPSKIHALLGAEAWLQAFKGEAARIQGLPPDKLSMLNKCIDKREKMDLKLRRVALAISQVRSTAGVDAAQQKADAASRQASFDALGGDAALKALKAFNSIARTQIPVGTDGDVASQQKALIGADAWLDAVADQLADGDVVRSGIAARLRSGISLEKRLKHLGEQIRTTLGYPGDDVISAANAALPA
jgi:hypothetical protein